MDRPVHLTNIFDPASTPAQAILELSWLVLWICAGIFVIVVVLLMLGFQIDPKSIAQVPGLLQAGLVLFITLAWEAWCTLFIALCFILCFTTLAC